MSQQNEVNQKLHNCQNFIRSLTFVKCERNDVVHWFRVFCDHLTQIIELVGDRHRINKQAVESVQGTLLLAFVQTLTGLSLLINIFTREEEINDTILQARTCVMKQIICCLESIEVALNCNQTLEDPSGNFVRWMDAALEKISQVKTHKSRETCTETQKLCEEVLSHAMSIAQVSQDSKMIRGSCQAVLTTLKSLEKEIKNVVINEAMVGLFADACSTKLCSLERNVNTAVLKMCCRTFAQLAEPLEKIQTFCAETNKDCVQQLDGLIADFDLHVDKIMQIGLFAVSCSSDLSRGIKLRSCLASLEALEAELVPALTSLCLNKSAQNINCAQILTAHWLHQAKLLQQLVFLIIDPLAFCHIIYDEASELVDYFTNKKIQESDVEQFLRIARVLKTFLDKAQGEFSETETFALQSNLKDFNDVLQEVESAAKLLLNEQNYSLNSCKRVTRRCKILLVVVKRLWYCFADFEPNKNSSIVETQESNLQQTNVLDNIIKRGRQILQDRSILYKTPIKMSVKPTQVTYVVNNETPLVNTRKFGFKMLGTNLDLQMTDILHEMSNLSTTFTHV